MILKELLKENSEVCTATEDARISDVADTMRCKRIGSIVIVDDSLHAKGIITDRDIAMALALAAATPDSFVSEVMSRDVDTISDSMTLFDVTRYFRTAEVKRLPVVNSKHQIVGIVSSDDVIALLARELFDTCQFMEPRLGHMI